MIVTLRQSRQARGPLTCQGGSDLLVHNDPHVDATIRGIEEHLVEAVPLIEGGRATQVELRAQPPVQNVDALLCV